MTQEFIDRVVELTDKNLTVEEIVPIVGLSVASVYRVLKAAGVRPYRFLARDAVMWHPDKTAAWIAEKYGKNIKAIYHAAERAKIKLPRAECGSSVASVTVTLGKRKLKMEAIRFYELYGEPVAALRGLTGVHWGVPMAIIEVVTPTPGSPWLDLSKQPPSRTCRVCEVRKPLTEFFPRKDGAEGRRRECKECHVETMAKRRTAARGA